MSNFDLKPGDRVSAEPADKTVVLIDVDGDEWRYEDDAEAGVSGWYWTAGDIRSFIKRPFVNIPDVAIPGYLAVAKAGA